MASPARFSNSRWSFTVSAVTSAKANFPASNLNVVGNHPLLYSWRSNNQTSQQVIILDLGATRTVGVVALLNLNVTSVHLSWSLLGAPFTNFIGSTATDPIGTVVAGVFPVTRNPFGVYRNRIVIQTVIARFIGIDIPAQATTDGASSFELGMVWIAPFLSSFPSGPRVGIRQTPKRNYIRAGDGVATAGPWYSEEEWSMASKSTETNVHTEFAFTGLETPQLIYKNLKNPAEVGIFRLRENITFERNGKYIVINPLLEELA